MLTRSFIPILCLIFSLLVFLVLAANDEEVTNAIREGDPIDDEQDLDERFVYLFSKV